MAEYNPISNCLKTIMFNPTTMTSNMTIKLLVESPGLKLLIIKLTKSLPPVEAFVFNIIAVPKPINTPPYIHANTLSCVIAGYILNQSINRDSKTVPINVLAKNSFPILTQNIAERK